METPPLLVQGVQRSFVTGRRFERLQARLRGRPAPPVHHVLRGVDLELHEGQWLAVLGENGAGKTTLLKTIAGLVLPEAGTISVDGHDVVRQPDRARERVGYVLAEERSFHWRLGGRDNLAFFGRLEQLPPRELAPRVEHLLERLDLARDADRPFAEWSTGMRLRLAVARALLRPPRVLLLDEPTRSLDRGHAEAVWALVRDEVATTDGCVVLVSHQVGDALEQCDRAALLEDGRLRGLAQHDIDQLLAPRVSANGYGGYTVQVAGATARAIEAARAVAGVRDLRIASSTGDRVTLDAWTGPGFDLAAFVSALTDAGASLTGLRPTALSLHSMLEHLSAEPERSAV